MSILLAGSQQKWFVLAVLCVSLAKNFGLGFVANKVNHVPYLANQNMGTLRGKNVLVAAVSSKSRTHDAVYANAATMTHDNLAFNRTTFENQYRNDGTVSRRWAEFLRETAPFLQQAAALWASGRLSRDDPSLASACRKTLTNLGPVFVKLGQILSVREDILGQVWSDELAKLQNSVDAFGGPEAVEEALASDRMLRDGLEWYDPAPIAVASIAQVHKGTWRNIEDGSTTDVAIKVLRPNVRNQVGVDLCVLLRAGDLLSKGVPRILPVSRVDWEALLAGLAKGLWEEVDLSGEAQRQTRFRNNMESVVGAARVCTKSCCLQSRRYDIGMGGWYASEIDTIHGQSTQRSTSLDERCLLQIHVRRRLLSCGWPWG